MKHKAENSLSIAQIQREHAGLWVAVSHGEVIDAQLNAYELHRSLHQHQIKDAMIFRCPRPEEPELVGLG